MNRKISIGMAVTIVILAMTVTFSITMLVAMRLFDSTVSSVKEKESMYNKIAEVDRYVRSNDYYTIDENTLYDRLTAGYLLGTGDKYARYYNATAYTELVNVQNGTILGIGVELGLDQTGYAKVTKVYDGSPAQEAGIVVGNYITAVGDTDVKSLTTVDAVQSRLQGEAGTTVTVTWLDSAASSHTADLTHSGYTSTTVDYQMLGDVGYIKIRQFDGSTPSELDYAIRALSANGAASLVFDLRDNGGGILDDAISCINLIAPEGTVAYAEDKNGNRTVVGSSDSETETALPLVCLVNGSTASAAELFAASLRTMSGARLVGTTTMGKGTIQSSPQRLSDGSAVSITVAKLLCGDGTSFDGTGLSVDVERALSADEANSYLDYTPTTDPQVQRAVSAAQQLSGTTTVAGANDSASSAAASEAADSTAAAGRDDGRGGQLQAGAAGRAEGGPESPHCGRVSGHAGGRVRQPALLHHQPHRHEAAGRPPAHRELDRHGPERGSRPSGRDPRHPGFQRHQLRGELLRHLEDDVHRRSGQLLPGSQGDQRGGPHGHPPYPRRAGRGRGGLFCPHPRGLWPAPQDRCQRHRQRPLTAQRECHPRH